MDEDPLPHRFVANGSGADAGTVTDFWIGRRCDPVRIEGRRRRVGGALDAIVVTVTAVDDDEDAESEEAPSEEECCPSRLLPFALFFLELGLGGGLSSRVGSIFTGMPVLSSPSSSPDSKSNIFPKFKPTLGELLNNLATSVGVGVARLSPVAVRTTPFIADGANSGFGGRVRGVKRGRE